MKSVRPERIRELAGAEAPYQRIDSVRLSEPRIEAVARRLKALLEVVQVESGGEPVEIDGFRLRDPADWTAPQGSANSELWHISTACNMRCPFCYEEGDPGDASALNEPAGMVTVEEIDTRLRHADAASGTGLFRPLTYINEMFCNPRALEIMGRVRAAMPPGEVFTFVTNGTYLDEPTVRRLAEFKPLFFNFSVNSLDPEIRRRVLADREPATAIASLELLRAHRIPYLGSLVCWPTIPWDDIEHTVRELDRAGCAVVRFSLSAYSRWLRSKRDAYDRQAFWSEGLALARRLQQELDTPVKVEPFAYDRPTYAPVLAGTVKGSPASLAGLRAGDVLTGVGGTPVVSANQALGAIARARKRGERRLDVRYRPAGDGAERAAVLDEDGGPFGYPYDDMRGFAGFEWGLLLVENLKFETLKQMRAIIDRRGARSVLVCSSELMRPVVEEMVAVSGAFDDVDVRLEVPENRFFGGSIVLGDLLVVDDYVEFLREYRERAEHPVDLVLVPSSPFSLGGWQRDLTGTPWTDIERRTGLPVELVKLRPLNG